MVHDDDGLDPDGPDQEFDANEIIREIEEMLRSSGITPKKLKAPERRKLVLKLRGDGYTIGQIAEALGVSYGTVMNDSHEAVKDIDVTRMLESEVKYDLTRIERLIGAYWRRALMGDLNSAKFIDQMLGRKHRLLGMEAPKRVDIRGLIVQWANANGLGADINEVIEATYELLPEADGD